MSLYGADFLRNASRLLQVDGLDPPDMRFQPHGYLFLASEEGAEIMQENNRVQVEGSKRLLLFKKDTQTLAVYPKQYRSRIFCLCSGMSGIFLYLCENIQLQKIINAFTKETTRCFPPGD